MPTRRDRVLTWILLITSALTLVSLVGWAFLGQVLPLAADAVSRPIGVAATVFFSFVGHVVLAAVASVLIVILSRGAARALGVCGIALPLLVIAASPFLRLLSRHSRFLAVGLVASALLPLLSLAIGITGIVVAVRRARATNALQPPAVAPTL
jgi:hypothetical protein